MSLGNFTDRVKKPSDDEVLTSLAQSRDLWEETIRFIENHYGTKKTYKFYGRNYGWALQFSKSGKALVSLYPGQGEFVAQVILNKDQYEEALSSSISEDTKLIIKSTTEIHEGKWIFVKVRSKNDADDIRKLISLRAIIKK